MTPDDEFRLLLAIAPPLLRVALDRCLNGIDHIKIVGEAVSSRATLAEAVYARPDVIVVDSTLPSVDGVALVTKLRSLLPGVGILIVADEADVDLVHRAFDQGADGYVTTAAGRADVLHAIEEVARGQVVLPPDLVGPLLRSLLARRHREAEAVRRFTRLTPKEREVLGLLALGKSRAAIAGQLSASPETIRTHLQRALRKLDVHSRLEALALIDELGNLRTVLLHSGPPVGDPAMAT